MGQRAVELMGERALQRKAFGKRIAEHGAFANEYAECIIELNAARLTVLDAASSLDRHGNKKVCICCACIRDLWIGGSIASSFLVYKSEISAIYIYKYSIFPIG